MVQNRAAVTEPAALNLEQSTDQLVGERPRAGRRGQVRHGLVYAALVAFCGTFWAAVFYYFP